MKGVNLAEWAIRHKQIVYFFIIAILIGGIWSYFHLGRSEDPNFTIRQMVVTAAWPGASAEEITEQVTDPLEKKLQDTRGLDYLKSFTHDGKTIIYVNLKDSVPADEVETRWHDVRNMVTDVWGDMPAGVVGPVINDRFDDVYGSIYAVTGDGFSYEEKRAYAEALRQRMLRIEDVQKVELLGVQEQAIYVEMDQNKLASFGMSPTDVFQLIRQQGLMTPSGMIHTDARNVAIRVTGLLPAAEAIRAIPIHVGERSFRLGDVATVTQTYTDPETALMYFNGRPAVGVAVSMSPGGDNLKLGKISPLRRNAAGFPGGALRGARGGSAEGGERLHPGIHGGAHGSAGDRHGGELLLSGPPERTGARPVRARGGVRVLPLHGVQGHRPPHRVAGLAHRIAGASRG